MLRTGSTAFATRQKPALFHRILVAVDGSPLSERAVRTAVAIARDDAHTQLAICHVIDVDALLVRAERGVDDFALALSHTRTAAKEILRQSWTIARGAGLSGVVFLREGKAAEEIQQLADEFDADLVVIGGAARSKLRRLLCGSTRDELIERSARPLLVVRGGSSRTDNFAPACIVVPFEGSAPRGSALGLASEIAAAHGAELILLGAGATQPDLLHVIAEHRPDALVMSASTRSPIRRLFPNMADRVLAQGDMPVFVVHDR